MILDGVFGPSGWAPFGATGYSVSTTPSEPDPVVPPADTGTPGSGIVRTRAVLRFGTHSRTTAPGETPAHIWIDGRILSGPVIRRRVVEAEAGTLGGVVQADLSFLESRAPA